VKILCVSDTVLPQMEMAAHLRRRYHDVDLLLSCGDMPAAYLEFITSVLNVPLFYVRGNHDAAYDERPPGGEDLHRRIIDYKGIAFYGIEGSIRYNSMPVQYSEGEMRSMVMRDSVSLRLRKWRKGRSIDVFVTHAPPFGIHDLDDLPHKGIKAFLRFMDWHKPRYLVHGHVHTWDRRSTVITQYGETCVMNINPVTLLEIEPE
jgi:Icc-related predicted phosphoesterase